MFKPGLLWCLLVSSIVYAQSGTLMPRKADELLTQYAAWRSAGDFVVVQSDRLGRSVLRPVETKSGSREASVVDGYRLLVALKSGQPFANLKIEQFVANRFDRDKQALIDNLQSLASGTPGMETASPTRLQINGFDVYGVNRKQLEGGVLSVYLLIDNANHVIATAYLLNADPAERDFKTIDEFHTLRDKFLHGYTAWMKKPR